MNRTPIARLLSPAIFNTPLLGLPPEAQRVFDETNARFAARFPNGISGPRASVTPAAEPEDEAPALTVAHFERLIDVIRNDATRADRELTDRELDRIDAAQAEIAALMVDDPQANAAALKINARRTSPEPMNEPGDRGRGAPQASVWKDKEGRPVRMLNSTDSLVSLQPRAATFGAQRQTPGLGQAIVAMITGDWRGLDPRAALSEGVDSAGGYFLTPQLSSEVIDLARAASVISQAGARTVPMSTSELDLVRITDDPDVSWVPENGLIPFTSATFGRLAFRAKKMAAIVPISRELVEDAPNAASEIQRLLGISLGQELDRVAIFGAGIGGEPIGLMRADGVQSMTPTGSPASLTYDTLLDAIALVEAANGKPNAYVLDAARKRTLARLKDTQGAYLMPPVDVSALTRFVTNKLTDDIAVLGDFRQILIGVRIGVQIEISRDASAAFEHDQIWIKVRWRGDVQFALPQHLVKITGIA